MYKLSSWTASVGLAFGLASCGDSVDTSSSGAGGEGGDTTTSGNTTANSSGSMAGSGGGTGSGGGMTGSGGGTGSGGSMTGTGGSGCAPKTMDTSAIGTDCEGTMQCPPGYTCQPFMGFILQYKCEILCTASCECPAGIQCVTVSDKGNTWQQCGP